MGFRVVRRTVATSFAFASLAIAVAAAPVLAGSVTLSYAKSLPFTPVKSGNISVTYGGGYNSFWLTTSYSDIFRLAAPEGVGSTGLNSPNFTYGGATGGKIIVRLKGSFSWAWQCQALGTGFVQGGANLVVQLYDATLKRVAVAKTLRTSSMLACGSPYPAQSASGQMPTDYSPVFTGTRIVKGHVYRVLVGMGAAVAGSNIATSASLTVMGRNLSATASW